MDQDHDDMIADPPDTPAEDAVGNPPATPHGSSDDPLVAPVTVPGPGPIAHPPRRPAAALLTWGIAALVLVIVVVLVVIKVTGTSPTTTTSNTPPPPAPPAVVQAVTKIPASVYDTVGVTSPDAAVTPPTILSGASPLEVHGKPEIVYIGNEFCPYCAAERWALVAALSRFGSFSGLAESQSGFNEAFPGTPTFSFAGATYSSRYITATLVEHYGNQKNPQGTGYAVLDRLNRSEKALLARYDGSATGSVLPFLDLANHAVLAGGAFSPAILQQLSSAEIANGLTDPKDPSTQAIVSAANEIAAVICSSDGQQPTSVCAGSGVVAASLSLGLSP